MTQVNKESSVPRSYVSNTKGEICWSLGGIIDLMGDQLVDRGWRSRGGVIVTWRN